MPLSSLPPARALVVEARRIGQLALPMMIAQGGLMAMGLVDTLLVGRVSTLEMSAVGLGNSITSFLLVVSIGVAMGVEPLAAQAFGAGDSARAHGWLAQGAYLALVVSLPMALIALVVGALLETFGVEAELASRTRHYLYARLPGLFANGLYSAFRSYLSSVQQNRPVLVASLVANGVNAALDAVLLFVFGLGAVGVGLATSGCWFLMLAILARAARENAPPEAVRWSRPDANALRLVFRIGWPVGLQLAAESGVFSLVSMFMARMGATTLAGHQIALSLASFTFMGAVGLAVATSARVGFFVGRGEDARAVFTGRLGIVLGGLFMGMAGLVFYLFRGPLSAAFAPHDPAAAAIGAELLAIAALFSVADGVQAVAAGALRGVADTRAAFALNMLGHWALGLPIALYLGFVRGQGPAGLWWGLTAGLVAVALGAVDSLRTNRPKTSRASLKVHGARRTG